MRQVKETNAQYRRLMEGLHWLTIEPPPPPSLMERFISALWVIAIILAILAAAGWVMAHLHYGMKEQAEKISVAALNGKPLLDKEGVMHLTEKAVRVKVSP